MLQEGQVGPQTLALGARSIIRQGPSGEVNVGDAHARFQEAVSRGNCYAVADQTGAALAAGLSASPVNVCLFNPKGNNKLAVIWRASIVSTVAPAAIVAVWIGVNTDIAAAAVTGTAAAPQNCMVGNANRSSISAFRTATLPAVPVAALVLGVIFTGAITTIPQQQSLGGWLDGSLIIAPGGAVSFQGSAASGAAACFADWVWEEIPI